MLINLHGELMPMPPLRNFSDAARSPGTTAFATKGLRVVTHAEELRTCHERAPRAPAGTLRLRLRVDAAGAVRSIHQGHFTLAHPEMIRCVQAAIFAWRLPSAGAPGAAELELAFRPDWSPAADP